MTDKFFLALLAGALLSAPMQAQEPRNPLPSNLAAVSPHGRLDLFTSGSPTSGRAILSKTYAKPS